MRMLKVATGIIIFVLLTFYGFSDLSQPLESPGYSVGMASVDSEIGGSYCPDQPIGDSEIGGDSEVGGSYSPSESDGEFGGSGSPTSSDSEPGGNSVCCSDRDGGRMLLCQGKDGRKRYLA